MLAQLKRRGFLGVSTIEARERLNVMSPASIIHRLRKEGWDIVTLHNEYSNSLGKTHRCAQYVLLSGALGEDS